MACINERHTSINSEGFRGIIFSSVTIDELGTFAEQLPLPIYWQAITR